ncbi:MAG TPA: DNA primase [Candidatus Saccharimonadia bacterium]
MDEVAEVKARLEITEVVGSYLPLKQAGRNLKAPCPFHEERSASFMVSPDKGIYHCFGCGEGGDIFNFVMKMEGLDFRSALEMLARKAGVELKAKSGENKEAQKLRDRLLRAHDLATTYYQASLVKNMRALEYVFKQRGLDKQTVRDFRIGYAPDAWGALTEFLFKQGFTQRELLQGGLAGQKEGRTTVYDLFRGRIMFPISDREGRPLAFTGRVLDDGVPKYLNTPQTPLFDKSSAIFGLHLAKESIRTKDEVVLVEGQMDVVACHQFGIKQVVATSGTALTIEHLRTLSKLTKNVKLAFDSDKAGLAATERAIEMGQKLGLTLRMVVLPEGVKDCDELARQDVGALEVAISGSKYIVDYLFDRFERDFDLNTAIGKRGYADRLASNLARLGDPVEQDHYVQLLAQKTGVSPEAVKAKIAGAEAPAPKPVAAAASVGAQEPVRRAVMQAPRKSPVRIQHEELLLGLNLMRADVRASLHDLSAEGFSSLERQAIYEALKRHSAAKGDKLAAKLGEVENYAKGLLLVAEEEYSGLEQLVVQQMAFELARTVLLESNAEKKAQLSVELREAELKGDEARRAQLLQQFQAIIESEA